MSSSQSERAREDERYEEDLLRMLLLGAMRRSLRMLLLERRSLRMLLLELQEARHTRVARVAV